MRTIKFRGWSEKHNKMFYVDFEELCSQYSVEGEANGTLNEHSVNVDCDEYKFVESMGYVGSVIMQFTGPKDKNGKEIYEDDIVKLNCGCIAQIRFDRAEFESFMTTEQIKKHVPHHKKDSIQYRWKFSCEVIGNIYENPELLKDGKERD